MTRFAGIAVHTSELHVTVLEENGEEVDHFTVGNDAAGFETMTERLRAADHVAIEACDPAYSVVEHLLCEGPEVQVGHPTKLSQLMNPDFKDDDRDSWYLVDLLRVGQFPPAYDPDPNAFLARDRSRLLRGHNRMVPVRAPTAQGSQSGRLSHSDSIVTSNNIDAANGRFEVEIDEEDMSDLLGDYWQRLIVDPSGPRSRPGSGYSRSTCRSDFDEASRSGPDFVRGCLGRLLLGGYTC